MRKEGPPPGGGLMRIFCGMQCFFRSLQDHDVDARNEPGCMILLFGPQDARSIPARASGPGTAPNTRWWVYLEWGVLFSSLGDGSAALTCRGQPYGGPCSAFGAVFERYRAVVQIGGFAGEAEAQA